MISTVLTQEQIGRIDEASLEVLQHVGVGIPHEQMLGMFADAGADVDRENQRVKIPPDLVRTLLAGAGKQFTLYGRDLSKTRPSDMARETTSQAQARHCGSTNSGASDDILVWRM